MTLRVGLTGGVASGKSVVADMFIELGGSLVDTDAISRELMAPGAPGFAPVLTAFGDRILATDGTIDRPALRAIVFSDAGQRRKLERILHPLIRKATLHALDETNTPYVIAAVPLLVETGFARFVDRVLVVHSTRRQQISRAMSRDGIDRQAAIAIIDAQVDEKTRLAAADDVIDNTGTLAQTRAQVERLHAQYLADSPR
jgi:dephospho-CoA kinase